MNRDHSVIFEIASQYCILDSFVDHDGYSISYKGFLPTVVDIMVIWVKFTHSSPFSLLIPRMLTFTLAISCLTTSNLPWFMDLTFQVPMQYCSLQRWTLLLWPVTSTAGYCFCFGSIPSFFLELFLHWSPVAHWAPTDPGFPLSVSYHFAFLYCSWGSQGKNSEVVCHSLLQWTSYQNIIVSASASVLPMNIHYWFRLGIFGLVSLQSRELSRVYSSTPVQNLQFFSVQRSL